MYKQKKNYSFHTMHTNDTPLLRYKMIKIALELHFKTVYDFNDINT